MPEPLEVFVRGDRVVLLHPDGPNWLTVSTNGAHVLSYCDGQTTIEEIITKLNEELEEDLTSEILELFDYGYKKGFLRDACYELNSDSSQEKTTLNSVHINLTKKCNLRCIHCYTKAEKGFKNELSLKEWKLVLDDLFVMNPNMQLVFTGGEPMLVSFLLDLANYAKKLGFRLELLTNGTLFQKNTIKQYAKIFDLIQISVDGGNEEIHEIHRGSGTFQKILNNLECLNRIRAPLQVAMVVTKKNKDNITEFRDLFANQMKLRIRFQPFYLLGRGVQRFDLELTGSEYYKALAKNRDYSSLGSFNNLPRRNVKKLTCGVGITTLSIDSNGDVFPCHLLHVKELKLGNIKEHSIKNIHKSSVMIYKNLTTDNIPECNVCPIRYICTGCRARALLYNDELLTKDPFCDYIKNIIFDTLFYLNE